MLSALLDVLCALHEAEGDVVSLVRHSPIHDVVDLALADDRQVDLHTGQVDVLLLSETAIVLDGAFHKAFTAFLHFQNDGSVLDEDDLAGLHVAGEVGVGDSHGVLVTLEAVVGDEGEVLTSLQLFLRVVHLEIACSNFGAAGVHHHLDLALAGVLAHALQGLLQIGELHVLLVVVSVGHVATDGVHALRDQLLQNFGIPARRADGGDDLRAALLVLGGLRNVCVGRRELEGELAESGRKASGGRNHGCPADRSDDVGGEHLC
mmetsp:Transcript_26870/g.58430  ORF Transcript_26870/g.58430 Transcript_26870/m.58430 type:complete len:263 (-) Transcript_26870:153-941(-)